MSKVLTVVNAKLFGVAADVTQLLERHNVTLTRAFAKKTDPVEEIARKLRDADVIIAGSQPIFNRELFSRLPKLKGIVRWGVGYDNIDLKDATEAGVMVSRLPSYVLKDAVAEHTVALMLSIMRKVPQTFQRLKSGEWPSSSNLEHFLGDTLMDKTIGFIGLGEIGFRVLEMIKPFKPKEIMVYDPYVSREFIRLSGALAANTIEEVLAQSDVITIHAPLTNETRKLLNLEKFKVMKRGVYLINTARGEIIDVDALIWALKEGIVKGAALDVFDPEPVPPNHPIFQFENVIITPHVAYGVSRSCYLMDRLAVEEALRMLHGERPLWILNPEVLERKR
ncbi:MAG: NAD(P)-dependent oxidoreductase [Desulfurococcaceae archaeon]